MPPALRSADPPASSTARAPDCNGAQTLRGRRGAARRCRRGGPSVPAGRPAGPMPSSAPARVRPATRAAHSSRTCGNPACASPAAPARPVAPRTRAPCDRRRRVTCGIGDRGQPGCDVDRARHVAVARRPRSAGRAPTARPGGCSRRRWPRAWPLRRPGRSRRVRTRRSCRGSPIVSPPRRSRRKRRAASRRTHAASPGPCRRARRSPAVDQARFRGQVGFGTQRGDGEVGDGVAVRAW